MEGIRKHIYVKAKDLDLWAQIEKEAERLERAVGWYLLDCYRQLHMVRHDTKAWKRGTDTIHIGMEKRFLAEGVALEESISSEQHAENKERLEELKVIKPDTAEDISTMSEEDQEKPETAKPARRKKVEESGLFGSYSKNRQLGVR